MSDEQDPKKKKPSVRSRPPQISERCRGRRRRCSFATISSLRIKRSLRVNHNHREPIAGTVNIALEVNGAKRTVTVEPRTTLPQCVAQQS